MVEVRLLLTILYSNGGAEQRLMDLRRQTQHQVVHLIPPLWGTVGDTRPIPHTPCGKRPLI
jgi:hypothetical protein